MPITGAKSSSWAGLLGGLTGSRGSRPGGWWGASWPASSGQDGRWPGSWTSRGSRRTRPSSCCARRPLSPSHRSRAPCAKWSTGPVSASTRRTRSGDERSWGKLVPSPTEKHHHFCKPQLFDMLHFEMLKVYPSFPPDTEASLSRFCSGPGKQTATHDILKEKIGSTLAKLGSGVIQRERSYHGGWEWKIIGTPFRKGLTKK